MSYAGRCSIHIFRGRFSGAPINNNNLHIIEAGFSENNILAWAFLISLVTFIGTRLHACVCTCSL